MAEIMAEYLPPGVFNVVCGDRDTGRALVAHDIPAMVSVTGSVRAGMEVAATAAPTLKRVHLELGGKAPVIVFDDADLGVGGRDRRRRVLQRRPGLHGGHTGAGRAPACTTTFSPPWSSRPRGPSWAAPMSTAPISGR